MDKESRKVYREQKTGQSHLQLQHTTEELVETCKNHGRWEIPGCMFHMIGQPLPLGLVTVSETSKDLYYHSNHLQAFLWVLPEHMICREVRRCLKLKRFFFWSRKPTVLILLGNNKWLCVIISAIQYASVNWCLHIHYMWENSYLFNEKVAHFLQQHNNACWPLIGFAVGPE